MSYHRRPIDEGYKMDLLRQFKWDSEKNLLLKWHFKAPSSAKVSSLTKLALLVLLLLLAIDDDLVFGVDDLVYSPESRLRLLPSALVG